jgi:hypothetical protein
MDKMKNYKENEWEDKKKKFENKSKRKGRKYSRPRWCSG